MTGHPLVAAAVTLAIVYLLLAYALGGPIALVRLLVAAIRRRRRRYRGVPDDLLASSRFTIPVSVVLPAGGEPVIPAIEELLQLNYAELEVIVVNEGGADVLDALRERFALRAWEVFYRRTLATSPVRAIFRSGTDARLLVADCPGATRGDALNCGVNLARFRYVCCADARASYARDALLEAMRAAVEDPAHVVAVTTSLGALAADEARLSLPERGTLAALQRLSGLRTLLGKETRRRLGVSDDVHPGFTVWRRDVVIEAGGFPVDVPAEQLEMIFRVHRRLLRERVPYSILQLQTPVGTRRTQPSLTALVSERQQRHQAIVRVVWRYRGMLLNPRYGRIGLLDLPQYLFSALVVPWLELACLLALPFAAIAGAVTWGQLALIVGAIGFGNGVLLETAMLRAPWPADEQAQRRLIVLAPFEVFVSRPVQLYSRLTALLRLA
jgi:cellulose synthase/poly-beta-1,6-N-acetylglucosamine synthase-like glycosyltransferase